MVLREGDEPNICDVGVEDNVHVDSNAVISKN